MPHPPPDLGDLAHRLVRHEAGGSPDSTATAAAVEVVCSRLKDDLTNMLGSRGLAALMNRALALAKRERLLLAEVTVETERAACFTGLAEGLAAGSNEEAAAAGASVVAHLLGLLVLLLGEELGIQPVRKYWPSVASSIGGINE